MAIKSYIMNNKKKSTCIITAVLLFIAALFILIYVKNANAGVFVVDENGDRVQTHEIHVLEIVAQNGQQVLGYTVEGQEPITVEKIESYNGPLDIDIEDFKNATGFVLSKKDNGDGTFSYMVERSLLNKTFNENVLGDSMAAGEITVKAVQANELTLEDISEADLIFINSNDYNDNLLYYYDQIMMDGALGYEQGEKGASFNDTYLSEELRSSIAIKRICAAAGNATLAKQLTDEDFVDAGLPAYSALCLNLYQESIAALEPESITGNDEEEIRNYIDAFISDLNVTEKADALNYIKDKAGMVLTEEEKAEVGYYLSVGGWSDYNERNLDRYCEALASSGSALTVTMVQQNIISIPNGKALTEAINKLGTYKSMVPEDESGFSEDELQDIQDCFMVLNIGTLKEVLLDEYVNEFLSDEFVFTYPSSNTNIPYGELKDLVSNVNVEMQEEVLTELADAAGDEEKTAAFAALAYEKFEIADIDGYNKYYLDNYVAELEKITDTKTFRPDISEDTGYDLEKIKTFIADTNTVSVNKVITRSYDLSWTAAMGIYEYAMVDEKGLMYNTELLTKNTIGDYTQDLGNIIFTGTEENTVTLDNTNNMYKLLLLIRQIQYPYYRDNLAAKIDGLGVYYPDGADSDGNFAGEGISSWYKDTFGTDFTNYSKYHEPDVVGKTYSESGTEGSEINYVYKRIYSFTGAQFFGGESFVNTNLGDVDTSISGVITPGTGYSDGSSSSVEPADFDETSKFIFLDASKNGWTTASAWVWPEGGNGSWVDLTVHDASRHIFRLRVPDGVNYVIFTPAQTWGQGQTSNIKLPTEFDGVHYYLDGFNCTTTGTDKAYFGNLTTSINVAPAANPTEEQIVKYNGKLGLTFTGYNITNASYMIYNDGVTDGVWRNLSIGETITIGEDLPVGTMTNIRIKYDTNLADGAELSYWYRKNTDSYSVSISNILNKGVVEYYNNMSMDIEYASVTDFAYSVDDGEFIPAASGETISIGEGVTEGTATKVTFQYKVNGVEKTVITTLSKKQFEYSSEDGNYLSVHTATAIDGLVYDNTLSAAVNGILVNGNKGDVVRYIMNVTLNEIQGTLNILEIEPAAAVTVLDSANGAKMLAEYLNLDIADDLSVKANRDKYFNVTYMSVKEFNTRNEDLTAKYDLIYVGIDSGYIKIKNYTLNGTTFYRTQYNDKTMNGLVYTGIGDNYNVDPMMRGVAAEDYVPLSSTQRITNATQLIEVGYWKKYFFDGFTGSFNYLDPDKDYILNSSNTTTRLSGNDLTVRSKDKLIDYLKSGYPILLEDEIMNCDSDLLYIDAQENVDNAEVAAKWRWVDKNSKMYAFVQEAKNLGKNSAGVYEGLDADGNPVFSDGKTYPSLVSVSYAADGKNPENLSDSHKLEGGLSFAIKRISKVEFELVDRPTEYNKNADGTRVTGGNIGHTIDSDSAEYKKYSFTLNVKTNVSPEWLEENYSYQMYIDKSGIGKFEDDVTIQIDPLVEYQYGEDGTLQAIVSGNWPEGLEGFVPWKLEAYNNANPELKFSYTGFSAFKANSGKRDVFVLWVRHEYKPGSTNDGLTLNFTKSISDHESQITEYTIHLVSMTYTQFNNMWSSTDDGMECTSENSKLKVKTVVEYMQSKGYSTAYNLNMGSDVAIEDTDFNMLVFGFSDSYSDTSGRHLDIHNINALKNIEYFINSGNSLLFTHDGSSYLSTMNYYTNTSGARVSVDSSWYWGRYTTAYMRSMLGMDLYGITYSSDELPESAVNARKYLSDNISAADLRGFTDLCVFKYTASNNGNQLYTNSLHSTNVYYLNNWVYSTNVMKVNEGQITEYPFVLDETIPTATTHVQYMQLDMEDADTTVWYTLDGSSGYYKYSKGDGANNYYIYSNGNITYTGSGHSQINERTHLQEQRLFINTVIFALKAGNLAPTIQFPYAYTLTGDTNNYMDYYPEDPSTKGLVISFRPIDYDKNTGVTGTFRHCRIYIDLDDNGSYTDGVDILLNDTDSAEGYANTSAYIKNISNTEYITIQAEEIANRSLVSFLISKEDIEKLAIDYPAFENLYTHKIYVEVTDTGSMNETGGGTMAKNSVMVKEQVYVDPQYMNLN